MDEQPGSDMIEKAWAVLGLLAAIALAYMSVDLLLPRKQPEATADATD
jgi:hypothetical protein